jgi:hypothetical protein
MLKYQNLKFFNGNSGELDFYYDQDEQYWSGVVYLPKVSAGLYETANLFIFEEVMGDNGAIEWIRPIAENNSTTFRFKFFDEEGSSDAIFIYDAVIDSNGQYEIQIKDYADIDPNLISANQGISLYTESNSSAGNVTKSVEYKTVGNQHPYEKDAIHFSVAINSSEEKHHTRLLNIYEVINGVEGEVFAAIRFYGETVEEDERLKVLLSNMGLSINEEDTIIFKESDVNELSTDWQIINNKRKELLLEAHNIAPFIGTYKALLNAIKFYGYDNLTMKEYWLNINEQSENFGKLKAIAIPNQNEKGFLIEKADRVELPSSNLKKTSRFSLHYRINEPTGKFNELDLPLTQETSVFSPDEILIKLYGLKKKLQKEYLPLQAKIVDITGEADFFSQFKQNIWNNQQTIKVQSSGVETEFQIFPERQLFIEDLRLINYSFNQSYCETNPSVAIEDIHGFYGSYYNQELNTFPTLSPTPIGCPIVLNITSLPQDWDSADFTWNDADLAANDYTGMNATLVTMDNWWHRGVYEAEWIVSGPNNYYYSVRKSVDDLMSMPLVLPYSGSYDVTLNLYDLYNARSYRDKKSGIVVNNKSVEIYGVYEWKKKADTWNDYTALIGMAGGTFDLPQENPTQLQDVCATWYLTLDRANYVHTAENNALEFTTVRRYIDPNSPTGFSETTGPYVWKALKEATWNDGEFVNWDSMRVGADLAASFTMDIRQDQGYTNNSYLKIEWYNQATGLVETDQYQIQTTYPLSDNDIAVWQNVADELNNVNQTQHPLISKFTYNTVLKDLNGDGNEDICVFILAVGKEYSSSYDFTNVYFTNSTGGLIDGKVNYKGYNPTYNDLRIIYGHQNISILNHVTFSYDKGNMPGIVSQRWKLTNISKNDGDIYYDNQWLTYLFKERGDYVLELELTDCNGNKNQTKRNIITII